MSFGDIPSKMYFKTIDTGETPHLGTFTLGDDMQINYARLLLFKKALTITTEQLRVVIFSSSSVGVGTAIATSAWSSLIDITNLATNWIGFIRFTFAGEFLDASSSYFIRLETNNYTAVVDTSYLAVSLDWPNPINTSTVLSDPAIGIELYGTL